ncbi:MAG: hypothetical protein AUG45_08500 [Ktedonobacter sp. 13_1_20CM_3_54_15]|nr:MAG: hypothetical protein AUG45_08500 [Ktedonobacter sp. 13_1_20CM_3_54_15]
MELLRTNVVSAKALRPRGAGLATAAVASVRSLAIWAIKCPTFHEKDSNTMYFSLYKPVKSYVETLHLLAAGAYAC